MTSPEGAVDGDRIVLDIAPIPQPNLDACARVLARLAVEKAVGEQGLDFGGQLGDNVGNPHKAAPPGVSAPNGAKEQVT